MLTNVNIIFVGLSCFADVKKSSKYVVLSEFVGVNKMHVLRVTAKGG
jgi:hypothetical protein